jgi:hypothetical protein
MSRPVSTSFSDATLGALASLLALVVDFGVISLAPFLALSCCGVISIAEQGGVVKPGRLCNLPMVRN